MGLAVGMNIYNIRGGRHNAPPIRLPRRALGGAEKTSLQGPFETEDGHYFHLRGFFFSETPDLVSDADRARGREGRPVRKEEKCLAKADRQWRAAERWLQASPPNHPGHVEDSRPGASESTTGSDSGPGGSAPTSSEPIGSEPDWHVEGPNEHRRATAAVSPPSHAHRYARCASFSKRRTLAIDP